MTIFDLLRDPRLFAAEDGTGGGEGAGSAGDETGGAAAAAGDGGNAGTEDGRKAGDTSILAGKPGEQKPADAAGEDGAAKENGDEDDKGEPEDKVPEDGKYSYDLPEGVEVDEKVAGEVSAIFKEAGLTQKQAGAVAAKYVALVQQHADQQAELIGKTFDGWVEKAKADEEIGGDKWDASVASANSVLSRFGTPELDTVLATSGVGNHPELIRIFDRIGKAIADDKFVAGQSAVQDRPVEERMYAKTTPSGKRA